MLVKLRRYYMIAAELLVFILLIGHFINFLAALNALNALKL